MCGSKWKSSMFFYVTTANTPDIQSPFVCLHRFGNFTLLLDQGWHKFDNCFYKGYCLDAKIEDKISTKDFSEKKGNYTILRMDNNRCTLHHDDSRSFPLYYCVDTITNFASEKLTPVWFDGTVYYDTQWHFKPRPDNKILYNKWQNLFTKSQLVDLYCNYLVECVNSLTTDLPLYCAHSEGVDSTAVRSAFDYCGKDYKLVSENSVEKKYLGWGYKQLFITKEPHMQITGFCGDELLLRNPLYCQWLLDPYNIELIKEFDKVSHSYMKGFFDAKYKVKLQNRKEHFVDKEQAYNHAINVAINDFQMWHVDNTITFTPLRNRQIATECMYADIDAILDQVIHAGISKEIINRLNPKLLDTISKHKNDYE